MEEIHPREMLRHAPTVPTAFALPTVLSARLDVLVEAADRGGEPTSRKELLAAILLHARPDEHELATLVARYRKSQVCDALIAGEDEKRFLAPERPPGPRARRGGKGWSLEPTSRELQP